ncbi:MAG: cation transporter [Gemmatimonadota bacterium]|nr:MAG: cation transporter [Gemmatimonadota bacterium]
MPDQGAAARRSVRIRRVLIIILAANIAVVVAKLLVGIATDSLAVLGDTAHSSVDALNNILALVVVSIASRGPDEDHPYGHQKFETLGALAIVGFLSVAAFELSKGAVERLATGPPPLSISSIQITILLATLAINVGVASYESHKGRQLNSEILLADAAHTKADVFVTIGVIASLVLVRVGITWADPVLGLAVAVVIVILAYRIMSRSVPILVDRHLLPSSTIRRSAERVPGVKGAYDIRSRGSQNQSFAELTIAIERSVTVEDAHQIADAVESRLRSDLQLHEIIVHVEPC